MLKEDILNDARLSPFLSIEIDESTDASKTSQLSICVRYMRLSEPIERFIELCQIDNPNATELFARLMEFLEQWGGLGNKVIALATDSATVVASDQEGLYGKFL